MCVSVFCVLAVCAALPQEEGGAPSFIARLHHHVARDDKFIITITITIISSNYYYC